MEIYTHITLHVVHLSGMYNITGIWKTGPVVQAGDVVGMVDLDLVLPGQHKGHHVHWKVELGLGLVEVLLIEGITSNPG